MCRAWLDALPTRRNLVVPATVVAEACYLVERFGGPHTEALFLDDLAVGAYGTVTGLMPEDIQHMSDLVRQYADLPLGGTDASVIAVAERLHTACRPFRQSLPRTVRHSATMSAGALSGEPAS